ncbi:three-Cys-motif partner protein TcmP [Gordonia sp. FQ]|uniref:three-Cys-motif partner protein TcmP n=1 Tax=Gordonia sp. FQ TaxID=3446634 RepID=UPI003F840491
MAGRGWGPWSRIKLEALSDYLSAFTRASQSAHRSLYLDLFAGAKDNFERGTGNVIRGSGQRALSTQPPFSKVVLCELQPRTAAELKADLESEFPGREPEVLPGDCNVTMPDYLDRLDRRWRRGAVFAMVDQYAAEVRWETLQYLANWRQNERGFRVELWLYFGHALLPRGLGVRQTEPDPEFAERVDRMFGTRQWRELWHARRDEVIDAEQFRAELVNLMRWRLENELGYGVTIPLEFTNSSGTPIYTVIFATANETGAKVMGDVFAKHGVELAKMRNRSKAQKKLDKDPGDSLFSADEVTEMLTGKPEREPLQPPVEPMRYPPNRL